MKKLATFLAGTALMLMTAVSAMAVPITGEIGFTGVLTKYTPNGNISSATGLDFASAEVQTASGTFLPIPTLPPTPVTYKDFTFNPPAFVDNLWELTYAGVTYAFDLTDVDVLYQSSAALVLQGTGILQVTNYEDTPGIWTFSGQTGSLTFSAASTVPEPGTMILLGAGFLGLAIYGKRRKNA